MPARPAPMRATPLLRTVPLPSNATPLSNPNSAMLPPLPRQSSWRPRGEMPLLDSQEIEDVPAKSLEGFLGMTGVDAWRRDLWLAIGSALTAHVVGLRHSDLLESSCAASILGAIDATTHGAPPAIESAAGLAA